MNRITINPNMHDKVFLMRREESEQRGEGERGE
jgi:hypothetical protein